MDDATNFALDVQEMYQSGDVSLEKFKAILETKYGGSKRDDGITIDFGDGSVARWSVTENSWELNPKD